VSFGNNERNAWRLLIDLTIFSPTENIIMSQSESHLLCCNSGFSRRGFLAGCAGGLGATTVLSSEILAAKGITAENTSTVEPIKAEPMKMREQGALTGGPQTHAYTDSVLWEYMTPATFRRRINAAPVVYLPMGTLEWHGWHNPLGTDGLEFRALMVDLANTVGGVVMPMLFLGPDLVREHEEKMYYGMDLHDPKAGNWDTSTPRKLDGSAYWINDDLFHAIMEQIIANVARQGVKILMLQGHGPSQNWVWKNGPAMSKKYNIEILILGGSQVDSLKDPSVKIGYDHAGSYETSLMMHYYPTMVHLDEFDNHPDEPLLAVAGADPRVHASREQGKIIAGIEKAKAVEILNKLLSDLKKS